jgi:hypothetical protein
MRLCRSEIKSLEIIVTFYDSCKAKTFKMPQLVNWKRATIIMVYLGTDTVMVASLVHVHVPELVCPYHGSSKLVILASMDALSKSGSESEYARMRAPACVPGLLEDGFTVWACLVDNCCRLLWARTLTSMRL